MNPHIAARILYQSSKNLARQNELLAGLRFTFGLAVIIGALVMLAGCTEHPAAAQGIESTSAPNLRELTIEGQEIAYIAIANATQQIDRPKWLAAGWTWGSVMGAQDAVPSDCALHARTGGDTQVYAACIGPRLLMIPYDGADFIYVTLILGQDSQVRSYNVIAP